MDKTIMIKQELVLDMNQSDFNVDTVKKTIENSVNEVLKEVLTSAYSSVDHIAIIGVNVTLGGEVFEDDTDCEIPKGVDSDEIKMRFKKISQFLYEGVVNWIELRPTRGLESLFKLVSTSLDVDPKNFSYVRSIKSFQLELPTHQSHPLPILYLNEDNILYHSGVVGGYKELPYTIESLYQIKKSIKK